MKPFAFLAALQNYARRFPEEAATAQRFIQFVSTTDAWHDRSNWTGHVTGSAWIVNGEGSHVLLTHHRKLERWLQLGGHSDNESDPRTVARREAEEESGLVLRTVADEIFDIDVHQIPTRPGEPAHDHYDVRYALQTAGHEQYARNAESKALAWVPLNELEKYSRATSLVRMRNKWLRLRERLSAESQPSPPV